MFFNFKQATKMVRSLPLWLLISLLFACSNPASQSSTSPTSMSNIDIQGHRGCRGLLPENSLPAFVHAVDLGVHTLELDVVISRDSQVVVSHEPWLSSVICLDPEGKPVEEGSEEQWNLYQMDYADIARCDCGSRPHPRFPEQQLQATVKPLLKDVIAQVEAYVAKSGLAPVRYNIETKSDPRGDGLYHPEPETFTRLLIEQILAGGIAPRTTIQSFDPRTLVVARRLAPELELVLLLENAAERESKMAELGFSPAVLSPAFEGVDENLVSWCREKNMKLIPWTVNDTADMRRLIAMGVDGIITDYPDRLLGLK